MEPIVGRARDSTGEPGDVDSAARAPVRVAGALSAFRRGIGMSAWRLGVPVVPVRIQGLEHVLRVGWGMARPGRVRVAFGSPIRLTGDDYHALAGQVEKAVRQL